MKQIKLLTIAIILLSCGTDSRSDNQITQNDLIGDWNVSKYIFVNRLDNKVIGEALPVCNLTTYQLRSDNFLNIKYYHDRPKGVCLDTITNDDGTWSYKNNIINFFTDSDYNLNYISSSKLEIIDFDEGYIDYTNYDHNHDGVKDKVITVLVKK